MLKQLLMVLVGDMYSCKSQNKHISSNFPVLGLDFLLLLSSMFHLFFFFFPSSLLEDSSTQPSQVRVSVVQACAI